MDFERKRKKLIEFWNIISQPSTKKGNYLKNESSKVISFWPRKERNKRNLQLSTKKEKIRKKKEYYFIISHTRMYAYTRVKAYGLLFYFLFFQTGPTKSSGPGPKWEKTQFGLWKRSFFLFFRWTFIEKWTHKDARRSMKMNQHYTWMVEKEMI